MFVAIDNKDMDALKVEEWIKTNRDANGGVISPEFAMEILTKTNHFAHIKKVLNNIKKACLDENGKLVADKVLAYKDFILSCVDRREASPQAMAVLQELAETGGFKDEFAELNSKPKWYYKNDCDNIDIKIVKSERKFQALEGENLRVFFDADEIDLSRCNLDEIKNLRFRDGAKVNLSNSYYLPEGLDVSMCSEVDLGGCNLKGLNLKFNEGAKVRLDEASNLPKDLDVSMCSMVDLWGCDLEGMKLEFKEDAEIVLGCCDLSKVETIKFKEGAKVNLSYSKNLSEHLDVSMCSVVGLSGCDLGGLSLKFREGAEVNLCEAYNFSKDLDLSMCSSVRFLKNDFSGVNLILNGEVDVNFVEVMNLPKNLDVSKCPKVSLCCCDLEGLNLQFREGADVNLNGAKNLPKDLDLSMCSRIIMRCCDLRGMELKFREGARINLGFSSNFPKDLDFSMCSSVVLEQCDLRGVETIKFKDKEQQKKFMKETKNFTGKVEYVGDKERSKAVSVSSGGMAL